MTTRPLEQHDLPPIDTARFSRRYAIEQPELGWKRLPVSSVMPFLRGELRLPELANLVIRTASVRVRLSDRKVVGVWRIELDDVKMNAEGAVDQDEAIRRLVGKLDGNYKSPDPTPPAADAEEILRCLALGSHKP